MIVINKSFLESLRPAATVPMIFLLLIFIINNAWFPSLLFGTGRNYAVVVFFILSLFLLLNSRLLFSLRSLIILGSLFSCYMMLGILNDSFDITGFIMVITFWMNCFVVYCSLKKIEYDNVVRLCQSLIVGQFIFLAVVDFLNWLIRARGLPIVIETIVPVSVFGIFLLSFLRKDKQSLGRFYWIIAACSLYFIISIFADYALNEKKIQKIQFGLMTFTAIYFFVIYLFRSSMKKGALLYVLSPSKFILLLAFAIAINFILVTKTLVSLQPSSGFLRFAINVAMLKELSGTSLILGKGLGAAWKPFDVADLHPEAFMFEFDAMYPHSGLIVLLYEYGIIGLVVFSCFLFKYLLLPNINTKRLHKDSIGSRAFASWLWLGLVLFFLMQNGMYVQGIPSGDIYFQSNFILYAIFAWLIIKSRTTRLSTQSNTQPTTKFRFCGFLNSRQSVQRP